jgi:hypothetical protein
MLPAVIQWTDCHHHYLHLQTEQDGVMVTLYKVPGTDAVPVLVGLSIKLIEIFRDFFQSLQVNAVTDL